MESKRDELGSLQNGRYVIIKKLGEGGKGIVYKCHDTTLDRIVAVKLLKNETLDEETYSRFLREAQTTARMIHPNIVSIFDMGRQEGRFFLVMECIEGSSLRGVIQSTQSKGLDTKFLLKISIDVCKAMEYAHSKGVLHRDIKPENIMITTDGTAKLMDFGLARALDKPRLTSEGTMVGTPAYMSPENALGKESDQKSDLYSFGVVLYEMLTGYPLFRSQDSLKLIYSHIHDIPVSPSRIKPEIDPSLDKIVLKLLMKGPNDRFQSASDLLRTLQDISNRLGDYRSNKIQEQSLLVQDNERRGAGRAPTPELRRALPLIDREEEFQSLKAFVDALLIGQGGLIFLAGEAGIGKTRLAEELQSYANLRGVRCLSGRCISGDEGAPSYAPWIESLREFVLQSSTQQLFRLGGNYSEEISKLVPELKERIGGPVLLPATQSGVSASPTESDALSRTRFFEGILQFFLNMSKEFPVLIFIDDLNWADEVSLQLLHYIARKIKGQFIAILCTYRDVELQDDSSLSKLLFDLNRERLSTTIRLRRFDTTNVARMIAQTLDEKEEQQTAEFRNLLCEKTGGNPFFVEEVLRSLVEQGVLFRTDKGWDKKAISEIEIPTTVRAVIEQRLNRIGEESLNVLTVASVVGGEFSFEILQKVTGIEEEHLLDLMEKILKSHLLAERKLTPGKSVYKFADLQVRNVLHEGISLVRRRKYHLKIAQVMEELYKERVEKEEKFGELAYHFLEGNEQEKSLEYCMKAGVRASKVYAHEEAAKQFKLAVELMEEKGDRSSLAGEVFERLADTEYVIGRGDAAIRHYGEAAKIYEERGERRKAGTLLRKRGFAYYGMKYDLSGTRKSFDEAMEFLKDSESEELAQLLAVLGRFNHYTGQFSRGVEVAQRALVLAEKLQLPEVESLAHEALALLAPLSEKDKMLYHSLKGLEVALQNNLPFAASANYWTLTKIYVAGKGDMTKASEILQEGLAYTRSIGYLFWEVRLETYRAQVALIGGEPERAKEIIDAIGDHNLNTFAVARAEATGVLGQTCLRHGELIESEKYFLERLPLLQRAHDWQLLTWYYCGLGQLYLQKGEVNTAEEYLRKGYELFKEIGVAAFWASRLFNLLSLLVQAELKLGKLEEAKMHLAELSDKANLLGEDIGYAFASEAEGILDMNQKNWEKAVGSFRNSLSAWNKLGRPYEKAKTLYELGISYQQKGDRKEASERFNEALEIFSRVGAKLDVENVLARKDLLGA